MVIKISIIRFYKNIIEPNFIFYKDKQNKDFYIANFTLETLDKLDGQWTNNPKCRMPIYNYIAASNILYAINLKLNDLGYKQRLSIPNQHQTKEMLFEGSPDDFWKYSNFSKETSIERIYHPKFKTINEKNIEKYLRLIYDPNEEYYE